MTVTTLEIIPGKNVTRHYGLAQSNTELLAESRQEATDRMIQLVEALGANAVLNVRYSTSSTTQGY